MMPLKKLAVPSMLLAVAMQTGCSHPTQSAPTANTAETPTTQAIKTSPPQNASAASCEGCPVIVAFGDSLTAGYGAEAGHSYPDYLQHDLLRDGYRYRVVNLGVSGNTTKDGLARVADAVTLHPALVIVGLGGNDGLRGEPVPQMRANLDEILAELAKHHLHLLIGGITLPPNYGAGYVEQFNAVYPALAAKYHAPLLPFMLAGVWNHPQLMQADGIHPTAEGYAAVAQNFLPLVERQLARQGLPQ